MVINGWVVTMVAIMVVAAILVLVTYWSQYCRDYQFRHLFGLDPGCMNTRFLQNDTARLLRIQGSRVAAVHNEIIAIEESEDAVVAEFNEQATERSEELLCTLFVRRQSVELDRESSIRRLKDMHHAASRLRRGIVIMPNWYDYLPPKLRGDYS
jgi:hypothetical protein